VKKRGFSNLIPSATNFDIIDKFVKVKDDESAYKAREIARKEGLFVGDTSGAAMQAIEKLEAEGEFKNGDVVVVIFPDPESRYMSKIFSDD